MQITPTLLSILMGIYLCAAVYHFWVATKMKQTGIQLSFSVVCLMAAGYCLAAKGVYSASSIPAYLHALKLQVSVSCVFIAGVVWFTVYFANLTSRRFPILLSIVAGGLAALNQFLPAGIIVDTVHNLVYLRLPWGEQIAFPDTDVSQWAIALWSYSLTVYMFIFYSCYRLRQTGQRRAALVLFINVLSILSIAIYDLSVDLRQIRWMYLAEYRFLPCVISMVIYTSKSIKRQAARTTV
jgi:hypothetical protein